MFLKFQKSALRLKVRRGLDHGPLANNIQVKNLLNWICYWTGFVV